ncbi:MAG: tetratricopeptide repeat protein [Elusimicrobiales bacterium]
MKYLLPMLLSVLCAAPARASRQGEAYMRYIHGLLSEYEGKSEDAAADYAEVIKLDPKASSVGRQAVQLAARLGKMDEAARLTEELVKNDPAESDNWAMKGAVAWARNDRDGAIKAYEKAVSLNPANAPALYQAAQILKPSNPQAAYGYLDKYMEAEPEAAPQTLVEMANIKFKNGDPALAETLLKKCQSKFPDVITCRYALAQLYEISGDTEAALGQLKSVEPLDPASAALMSHLGGVCMALGKTEEARQYFLKTKKLDAGNSDAAFWLAALAEHDGDFAAAADYIRASSSYDSDPALSLRLSYYLTQTGRYSDAVGELEQARKKWPDNYELGYFLALGLDDTGQTRKAMDILKDITAAKPDYREAQLQYGIMAEKTGDMATAEAQFKKLLEKTPDDAMVLNYLGYSLADRGMKLDDAEGYIKRALSVSPDNGAYIDSLGWIYFKKGRHADALAQLKRAAGIINGDETVWQHLGDVFCALGDFKNGWLSYKISQGIKPDQKDIASKAETAEKKLSRADTAALALDFMKQARPRALKYGALCALTASGGGKAAEFGAIISYSSAALSLDVSGPLFTPAAGYKLSVEEGGARAFSSSYGAGSDQLDKIARRMMNLLYDYYSGGIYPPKPDKFSGGCLKARGGEVCLDKTGAFAEEFTRSDDGKVSLKTGFSKPGAGKMPDLMEFKSSGLKISFTVTKSQLEQQPRRYTVPGLE